jgi:hypothetical protein
LSFLRITHTSRPQHALQTPRKFKPAVQIPTTTPVALQRAAKTVITISDDSSPGSKRLGSDMSESSLESIGTSSKRRKTEDKENTAGFGQNSKGKSKALEDSPFVRPLFNERSSALSPHASDRTVVASPIIRHKKPFSCEDLAHVCRTHIVYALTGLKC